VAEILTGVLATLVGVLFNRIATHPKPHLDEIVAAWLLKHFGDKLFPGVSKARIVFWGHGGMTPDGRLVEEYLAQGILPVGVAGSLLDEHPKGDGERAKQKTCAAKLTAELLGVADDPALQQMLRYVLDKDTHGTAAPFDLAHLVKCMHEANPRHPKVVINAIWQMLDAKYHEQQEFWTTAMKEMEKAEWFSIRGANGEIRVCVVKTDCAQVPKYARSAQGGGAHIVIIQNSQGNVQILTDHAQKLCLDDLARLLRLAEQHAADGIKSKSRWRDLEAEGTQFGWHYHRHGRMLLNGSSTANKVAPTKIEFGLIKALVKLALDPDLYEPDHAPECKLGKCTATEKNPCQYHYFGLNRCQELRRRRR
jgi:hypothetical protein